MGQDVTYISIKDWAENDRPREKLLVQGARALSDAELLAILIGSGTRELSAVELSRQILNLGKNNLSELGRLSISELIKIKGVGEAKAITIQASLELGRRRAMSEPEVRPSLSSSGEVFVLFSPLLSDLAHEEFWVAYLNRSNKLIEKVHISKGGISGTVIDIRIILKRCIELLASSFILIHNHPSGNLQASAEDKKITSKLKEAAAFLDVSVLDHVIIAQNKFLSFADEGLL